MKHVILHYFFIVHLCDMKMCVTLQRYRPRSGRYDINGFISQLLASRRFDELAEKLAEKAANRIMNIKADHSPIERASDIHEAQNITESTTEKTKNQTAKAHVKRHGKIRGNNKVQVRKGFAGKIDTEAVMNESISLSENLKLKYKYLKTLEKKVKMQRDQASKNVTNEDLYKLNKTTGYKNDDYKNETEGRTSSKRNATQLDKGNVKTEPIDEKKSLRDNTKDDGPKDDPNRNSERNKYHSGTDGVTNQRSQKKHHRPKEPSPVQEPTTVQETSPVQEPTLVQEASTVQEPSSFQEPSPVQESSSFQEPSPVQETPSFQEPSPVQETPSFQEPSPVQEPSSFQEAISVQDLTNFRVETNSGAEVEEKEAINLDNGIKEEMPSSLDEQNRHYLPSGEKTNADVVNTGEEIQKDGLDENTEVGNAVAQSRGHEYRVEENKVPSDTDKLKPYEGIDRNVSSNDRGDRGSEERSPEKSGDSPAKPVIRREGNKVYTYVQNPEYEDYHEEMAKWKKAHPENPADFL